MAVPSGRRGVVAALLAVSVVTACQPHTGPSTTAFTTAIITPDGSDRYELSQRARRVVISAPSTNRSGNLRMVIVRDGTPTLFDQEACVTWTGPADGIIQPGIALRVRSTSERTRAVTVTNNILYGMRGSFNVHVTDSQAWTPEVDDRMRPMGRVQASWANDPLPWRICARVRGAIVTVKAWSLAATPTAPAWDDPVHTGSVRLPMAAVYSGRPGWYMGHLTPGDHTGFDEATTASLPRSPR